MQIAIADAKARFSELLRRVEAGEEIELTRHGRPVARLTAARAPMRRPLIGAMAGRFQAPEPDVGDAEVAELFGIGR